VAASLSGAAVPDPDAEVFLGATSFLAPARLNSVELMRVPALAKGTRRKSSKCFFLQQVLAEGRRGEEIVAVAGERAATGSGEGAQVLGEVRSNVLAKE